MMNFNLQHKVLSVVGPTAVGKTEFVFRVIDEIQQWASRVSGFDVISADSRQVFRDLPVMTGADIPAGFELVEVKTKVGNKVSDEESGLDYNYYQRGQVRLHGVAILDADQEWSLAHFKKLAIPLIKQSWAEHRLPIVVGGTGLYHRHLFNPDVQLHVPPNPKLRNESATKTLPQLQQQLKDLDLAYFNQMNHSDQNNPRRLMRALEIVVAKLNDQSRSANLHWSRSDLFNLPDQVDHLTVGLKREVSIIESQIAQRIENRLKTGAMTEVDHLMTNWSRVNLQLKTATGVAEIRAYLLDEIELTECKAKWLQRELQYVKRQFTWFKKQLDITWFDVDDPDWFAEAVSHIQNWLT